MLGLFRKKSNEKIKAERIYRTMIGRELGDMTPRRLRLPKGMYRRYRQKALVYREAWCLCALAVLAYDPHLRDVLAELVTIVETKRTRRGLRNMGIGYLMDAGFDSLEVLSANPCKWAQRWLMDFRDNPDDDYMLADFAEHWQQQYADLKKALDEPRPLLLPSPNSNPTPAFLWPQPGRSVQ
jgi:hypothetical protein